MLSDIRCCSTGRAEILFTKGVGRDTEQKETYFKLKVNSGMPGLRFSLKEEHSQEPEAILFAELLMCAAMQPLCGSRQVLGGALGVTLPSLCPRLKEAVF